MSTTCSFSGRKMHTQRHTSTISIFHVSRLTSNLGYPHTHSSSLLLLRKWCSYNYRIQSPKVQESNRVPSERTQEPKHPLHLTNNPRSLLAVRHNSLACRNRPSQITLRLAHSRGDTRVRSISKKKNHKISMRRFQPNTIKV